MNIREIENIIDHVHEGHPVFAQAKNQLTYELVATFEDICSLKILASMLNPAAIREIIDQMDALNMALQWAHTLAEEKNASLNVDISEERYKQCASLLCDYAHPYSSLCSGYISFSRKRFSANVDGNVITFNVSENQNGSAWSDILREANDSAAGIFLNHIAPAKLIRAVQILKSNISLKDNMLCYTLTSEVLSPFEEMATQQWEVSKTLPESWEFDSFSLMEYKKFWIALTTLCYIHFFACLEINDPLVRLKNCTIIQTEEHIIDYVISMSGLKKETVRAIINYITFDVSKKNIDIMYQPVVDVGGGKLIVAPMLFMGARPERNLLALVGLNNNDLEHSKEVNDLENLMIQDLESVVGGTLNAKTVQHKKIDASLPDIDFAVLDTVSNSALFCELKWFVAADSTKEVYAKEDEITHGCDQAELIMGYALINKAKFFKQVFDYDNGEEVDLFCCVVAKHNIRTQHKYVPVIDLKRILELFKSQSLNSVFHTIRNHEYEIGLPDDATITHHEIQYGGYVFRIPAICFGLQIDWE